MQKSIFVLLVLLALLIVTCVYEKTYTIYATSPNELKLIERKPIAQGESTDHTIPVEKKEVKAVIPPVVTAPKPIKPVEVKPEPKPKPVVEERTALEPKEVVQKEVTKKEVESSTKEKTAPPIATTVTAPKTPVAIKKEVSLPEPMPTQKSTAEASVEKTDEKEIVDYLMWALNNREIALKNRDEVEARIEELITNALNNRKIALDERKAVLDERSNNELELEKHQAELIDARDASYESVTNPTTTNEGEK